MEVLNPGHDFALAEYDGNGAGQRLVFMKREGPGYPFNVGHHAGTNCQEVLRALISRVKYLDRQIACEENMVILLSLRTALHAFEMRAARRHGRPYAASQVEMIEDEATCSQCGHIGCTAHGTSLSVG